MFEDLEKFMRDHRKEPSAGGSDSSFDMDVDKSDRIAKLVAEEFGLSKDEVMVSKEHIAIAKRPSTGVDGRLRDKLTGLAESIGYVATQLKVKTQCRDANGKNLAVGDVLHTTNGFTKTVLEVGFGFAKLSHTDDQTKDDGLWFEYEIKKVKLALTK